MAREEKTRGWGVGLPFQLKQLKNIFQKASSSSLSTSPLFHQSLLIHFRASLAMETGDHTKEEYCSQDITEVPQPILPLTPSHMPIELSTISTLLPHQAMTAPAGTVKSLLYSQWDVIAHPLISTPK